MPLTRLPHSLTPVLCCLTGLLAAVVGAKAQTSVEPPLQLETMVTEGPSLAANGLTRLRVEEAEPAVAITFANMAARIAGLQVNAGGAGSFGNVVALRGLANTPYFSDPSVTLYYGDIPLGSTFTYPVGLLGIGTVTALRGPQGTAFGRGGEGGVILLSAAEADPAAGGQVRLSVGNYETRSGAWSVHSARDPHFDATVATSYAARNGYIENTQLGTRVDDQEGSAVSAHLHWRPTPLAEFGLQFLGSRDRDGAQPLVPLGGPLYTVSRGREGGIDTDFAGAAFKAAFDTAFARLVATTSYTDWKLDPFANRLVLPPTLDSVLTQAQRTWNEEIRLTSVPRERWDWHLGAWFSDSETHGAVNRAIPGLFPIEGSAFALHGRTFAGFGGGEVALAERWHLALGLRAEETRKHFDRDQTVPFPDHFSDEKTFTAWTPKLTVRVAISARTNVSASVSTGTKPGGWSAYTDRAALAPFQAERVTAFEAGLDTTRADKTVALAVRVFHYAIRDYQIERSFNASDYLVVNAPRARSTGAEVEGAWHPAPGWSLAATLGVTQVTLREFTDPFTGLSYAGRRAPYAPDYDARLSLAWHPYQGWFASGELEATGRTYFDESENVRFAGRAHALLNAQAGYEARQWRLSLYGRNLTDAGYYTLVVPGVDHGVPGAPCTYGLEALFRF